MIRVTELNKFIGDDFLSIKVTEQAGLYDAELIFEYNPATQEAEASETFPYMPLKVLNACLMQYAIVVSIGGAN